MKNNPEPLPDRIQRMKLERFPIPGEWTANHSRSLLEGIEDDFEFAYSFVFLGFRCYMEKLATIYANEVLRKLEAAMKEPFQDRELVREQIQEELQTVTKRIRNQDWLKLLLKGTEQ